MKVTTTRRLVPSIRKMSDGTTQPFNGEVLCVRVKCDLCPAVHEYQGIVSQAEAKVKDAGWTVGSTGIVRCPKCSKAHHYLVNNVIGEIH